MSRLNRFIHEIHRRSLWQVLLIYVGGALFAYQAVQALTEGLGLPQWFPGLAVVLFVIGLPFVVATAFVHERAPASPAEAPGDDKRVAVAEAGREAATRRRLITWRNAVATFVVALALWGVIAAGWLLFHERTADSEDRRASIAVLPFENLSPDPDDAYFADGIHDEIISQLGKIGALKVISRTSVMEYRGELRNLRDIAQELGVANILEGAVRRAGDRVRITAQLIDARADEHLWAETYERELRDVFAIQSDIAHQIATALHAALTPEEVQRIEARPTDNLDAYNAYLQGWTYAEDWSSEASIRLGLQMFERAVALDPDFAHAHAALAYGHLALYGLGFDRGQERVAAARRAADRALTIEPDLAFGRVARGYYYMWVERDVERALQELLTAAAISPNDSDVLLAIGDLQVQVGRVEEGLAAYRRAVELDPRNADFVWALAWAYTWLRRYREAEPLYDRALELAPQRNAFYWFKANNEILWRGDLGAARATLERMPERRDSWWPWYWWELMRLERRFEDALELLSATPSFELLAGPLEFAPRALLEGQLLSALGDAENARARFEAARAILERAAQERPDDGRVRSSLGIAYAGLGRVEDAIREGRLGVELDPIERLPFDIGPMRLEYLATIYAMVGEVEAAIDELELLLSIPSFISVAQLRIDHRFDPLRDHPRFQALLEGYE
ncbi:MAG: tetratricopeptide repeat protein [Gemmatimonadota bacterium]|nr:MAG: tetratricopeptide repeat protein [Gemmatimonadota bacterium]